VGEEGTLRLGNWDIAEFHAVSVFSPRRKICVI